MRTDELRGKWRTFWKVTWADFEQAYTAYRQAFKTWKETPIGPRPEHPPIPDIPDELRDMR